MDVEQMPVVEIKEKFLWKAKLAQEANRFEEMAKYMRQVAECGVPMTKEEDNMLAAAYKSVLDTKRSSRRTLVTIEQKDGITSWEATVVRHYRARIDDELRALCTEVLTLVDRWLMSDQPETSDPSTGVFYWKLCADYNRYAAEVIDDPDDRAAVVAISRAAYEQADRLGRKNLRPIDPIRLGLMLNYSVFLYQVCQQRRQGHDVAKLAFDEALAEIDTIEESMYDDSTLILRLIRDNLTIWIQENGGESYARASENQTALVAFSVEDDIVQTDLVTTDTVATSTVLLPLSPSTVAVESQPDIDRRSLQDNAN
ncbi:PREDICTED: 14-3-3 protein zeta/delta-like [Diuraphis noxia]|uniref:14-3-3 protein zeta/delta-like n=1 Tax=Diuraphis noxia TaxID=143948 RepID=UPI000763B295|nr:PREDICTED: 14-3-3 protein zeta/delta-like [Diuraphis noxia]